MLDEIGQGRLQANRDFLNMSLPCELGYKRMVKIFLDADADVQAQATEACVPPLLIAAYGAYGEPKKMLALLLDHGADINTPWNIPVQHFSRLGGGGLLDTTFSAGMTALHICAVTPCTAANTATLLLSPETLP